MPFQNPIAAGINLIRKALRSPNYVPGVSGWTINRDGTSEFAGSVIRGILSVLGSSGVKIVISAPGTQPTIQFISPDGTNQGFINLITGAGSQAQLGINSGHYTPADGTARYWRIYAQDSAMIMSQVQLADQVSNGGYLSQSYLGTFFGFYKPSGYTMIQITDGLVKLQNDKGTPVMFTNGGVNMPRGMLVNRKSTFAQTQQTVETKDSGIGDNTFIAYAGESYRLEYIAVAQSGGGVSVVEYRIRGVNTTDGSDPASPTTASTLLVSGQNGTTATGGPGQRQGFCKATLDCPADIAAGTWKVSAFYARTAGDTGSTAAVGQTASGYRSLTVEATGDTP